MTFIGRFMNIELEMNKTLVEEFLGKIKTVYPYKWIENKEDKTLVIYGEKQYQLPFKEKEGLFTLAIEELTTSERTFSIAFNELLFEARKKMMRIENIYERKKRRIEERQEEIQVIHLRRSEKAQLRLVAPMTKQTEMNIVKLETDYLLMELHEALVKNEEETVQYCKKRLQELVEQTQKILS
ncbi:hypothetical protein BTR23_09340 [Alkalihalophilus pseudofirmus]|nr:hypothetical protein BTR23_09340 [Alkalihalophilus pseudofirmus]